MHSSHQTQSTQPLIRSSQSLISPSGTAFRFSLSAFPFLAQQQHRAASDQTRPDQRSSGGRPRGLHWFASPLPAHQLLLSVSLVGSRELGRARLGAGRSRLGLAKGMGGKGWRVSTRNTKRQGCWADGAAWCAACWCAAAFLPWCWCWCWVLGAGVLAGPACLPAAGCAASSALCRVAATAAAAASAGLLGTAADQGIYPRLGAATLRRCDAGLVDPLLKTYFSADGPLAADGRRMDGGRVTDDDDDDDDVQGSGHSTTKNERQETTENDRTRKKKGKSRQCRCDGGGQAVGCPSKSGRRLI